MHVPQIRGAITRDLITKYHYFHTSFQIWPDQIKVRGEKEGGGEAGEGKNCTTSRVIRSGVRECRRELVVLKLPQRQFCGGAVARRKSIPFEGGCRDPGVGTDRGFGVWWALPSPGGAAQKLSVSGSTGNTASTAEGDFCQREV